MNQSGRVRRDEKVLDRGVRRRDDAAVTTSSAAGDEFIVAMLVGEGLLLDPGTGRLPRVTGVDWPDHQQRALDQPAAVPIGPLARLDGDPVRWLLPMAVRGTGSGAGPVCSLDDLGGLDETAEVAAAARGAVACWRGELPLPPRRPDWFRPDWWTEVEGWIDDQLAGLGRPRTGPVRTVKFWSLSAVLEVPTAAGPAYLKATCEWFRQEPRITDAVAVIAPELVPRVLAVDVDRVWMLMDALPGEPEGPKPEGAVATAARALADLQLRSVAQVDELAAAGCPDRGEEATLRSLGEVLRTGFEVGRLDEPERQDVLDLEPHLVDTIRRLYACGLPTVLSHGDLHLGNVATDGTALCFYDWTDACLSHPFLDAAHLAESAAEVGTGADVVWDAYLPIWRASTPDADLTRARSLAAEADRIFQLVSYEGIYRAQEEASLHEMAGVQVGTLRALLRTARQPST
jgi:aminoglycoside phosphotransferase